MKLFAYPLLLCTSLTIQTIQAMDPNSITFLISEPGNYAYSQDTFSDPIQTSDFTVTVSTSNVTLDLGGRRLGQLESNGISEFGAIIVNDGLSNVRIRNGVLCGLSGTAIILRPNCTNICIENLAIEKAKKGIFVHEGCFGVNLKHLCVAACTQEALQFEGTATSTIENCTLFDVTIESSATTTGSALSLNQCENFITENLALFRNGSTTTNLTLLDIRNCSQCMFNKGSIFNNHAGGITIAQLTTCQGCSFQSFEVRNNSCLQVNPFIGIQLSGSSKRNSFNNVIITRSQSPSDVIGFDLLAGSQNNSCINCKFQDSTGGNNVTAFRLSGSGSPSDNSGNSFLECRANGNTATGGDATGLRIQNADNGALEGYTAARHSAPSGVAAGILFESGTGGSNWFVRGCQVNQNVGSSDANSFGIHLATGSGNLFSQNLAFQNGATAPNQMAGLPAGSVSEQISANLNSLTMPLTNVVINS